MSISWTKNWTSADDGSIVGGSDLKNIQDDLASVLQTSDIGTNIQAYNTNLASLSSAHLEGTLNYVGNGSFETMSAATAREWTISGGTLAASSAPVYRGTKSLKVTVGSAGTATVSQTAIASITSADNTGMRSKYVTMSGMVYASAASTARLQVYDGTTTTTSDYHSGAAGWERLTKTAQLTSATGSVTARLLVSNSAAVAYFDEVAINPGRVGWNYSHRPDVTQIGPIAFGSTSAVVTKYINLPWRAEVVDFAVIQQAALPTTPGEFALMVSTTTVGTVTPSSAGAAGDITRQFSIDNGLIEDNQTLKVSRAASGTAYDSMVTVTIRRKI